MLSIFLMRVKSIEVIHQAIGQLQNFVNLSKKILASVRQDEAFLVHLLAKPLQEMYFLQDSFEK